MSSPLRPFPESFTSPILGTICSILARTDRKTLLCLQRVSKECWNLSVAFIYQRITLRTENDYNSLFHPLSSLIKVRPKGDRRSPLGRPPVDSPKPFRREDLPSGFWRLVTGLRYTTKLTVIGKVPTDMIETFAHFERIISRPSLKLDLPLMKQLDHLVLGEQRNRYVPERHLAYISDVIPLLRHRSILRPRHICIRPNSFSHPSDLKKIQLAPELQFISAHSVQFDSVCGLAFPGATHRYYCSEFGFTSSRISIYTDIDLIGTPFSDPDFEGPEGMYRELGDILGKEIRSLRGGTMIFTHVRDGWEEDDDYYQERIKLFAKGFKKSLPGYRPELWKRFDELMENASENEDREEAGEDDEEAKDGSKDVDGDVDDAEDNCKGSKEQIRFVKRSEAEPCPICHCRSYLQVWADDKRSDWSDPCSWYSSSVYCFGACVSPCDQLYDDSTYRSRLVWAVMG